MAAQSSSSSFPQPAAELLGRLVAARVDFVLLGERTSPMTIVPAPYARNLERLAKVRAELGAQATGIAVISEASSRYEELLYEAVARELYGVLRVQVVPEELAASGRGAGPGEIRVMRSSSVPA